MPAEGVDAHHDALTRQVTPLTSATPSAGRLGCTELAETALLPAFTHGADRSGVRSGANGPFRREPPGRHPCSRATRLAAALFAAALGLLGVVVVPQAAFAHGDDEAHEGYLLVQQALGHLAHDTSSKGIDLAMEKVDDALSAEDQEGVDVAEVEAGMRALEAGRVERGRSLLQESITQALAGQPAATGYETGTTVVGSAMPGRDGLDGQDLGLLAGSFAVAGLGLALAYRFRPRDSVRALQGRLKAEGHS